MTTKDTFRLIGISLQNKTSNANGKSSIDCGNLWGKFLSEGIASRITGKNSEDIYAVYYNYESDHTGLFSYFIGCKVSSDALVPTGLDSMIIPAGNYERIIAKGQMPDCISNAWIEIWNSGINRLYKYDFELYGEKSKDWSNVEVEIFLSIN